MPRYPAIWPAYCLVLLLGLLPGRLNAQEKKLREVRVRHKKTNTVADARLKDFSPGMKLLQLDSNLLQQYALQPLSQLLSQQVPVFIKSYGVNNLATLNFRGASAAQSQVYWNGVPLNNAALGMTDVSLLQVNLFDQISVAYGSAASLLGSGNVGGAVMLDQEHPHFDSTGHHSSRIAAEAGSFHQYKLSLKHSYSNQHWQAGLRLNGQSAANTFSYTGLNGQEQRMTNARLNSGSALATISYRFRSGSTLRLNSWYQLADREIPAALFESGSRKTQQDAALRFILDWQQLTDRPGSWYAKTALLRDRMTYDDPDIALQTTNTSWQSYTELGWRRSWGAHHRLLIFIPVNISWMRPDSQLRSQRKLALAGAYRYEGLKGRLQAALSFRAERINEQQAWLPGANLSYRLLDQLSLRANVQRSYRAPSLNEWYYSPGGNSALLPEEGWNMDAGYRLDLPIGSTLQLEHDLSAFDRRIKNWILWFGGSIWTPHNIARVHSRGIESTNSLVWRKRSWQVRAGLNTAFVLATTMDSYLPNDGSIGKQIPYAPRYNGQLNAGLGYKGFYLNYNHTYTGYRFTTTDESQFLKPYQTGNIYLSWNSRTPNNFSCNLMLQNAWNNRYQVVNMRPMPGRNVSVGISQVF